MPIKEIPKHEISQTRTQRYAQNTQWSCHFNRTEIVASSFVNFRFLPSGYRTRYSIRFHLHASELNEIPWHCCVHHIDGCSGNEIEYVYVEWDSNCATDEGSCVFKGVKELKVRRRGSRKVKVFEQETTVFSMETDSYRLSIVNNPTFHLFDCTIIVFSAIDTVQPSA